MCTIVDVSYIHDFAVIKGGRGVELPNPHSSREYVTDTVQISQNLLYALNIEYKNCFLKHTYENSRLNSLTYTIDQIRNANGIHIIVKNSKVYILLIFTHNIRFLYVAINLIERSPPLLHRSRYYVINNGNVAHAHLLHVCTESHIYVCEFGLVNNSNFSGVIVRTEFMGIVTCGPEFAARYYLPPTKHCPAYASTNSFLMYPRRRATTVRI